MAKEETYEERLQKYQKANPGATRPEFDRACAKVKANYEAQRNQAVEATANDLQEEASKKGVSVYDLAQEKLRESRKTDEKSGTDRSGARNLINAALGVIKGRKL